MVLLLLFWFSFTILLPCKLRTRLKIEKKMVSHRWRFSMRCLSRQRLELEFRQVKLRYTEDTWQFFHENYQLSRFIMRCNMRVLVLRMSRDFCEYCFKKPCDLSYDIIGPLYSRVHQNFNFRRSTVEKYWRPRYHFYTTQSNLYIYLSISDVSNQPHKETSTVMGVGDYYSLRQSGTSTLRGVATERENMPNRSLSLAFSAAHRK